MRTGFQVPPDVWRNYRCLDSLPLDTIPTKGRLRMHFFTLSRNLRALFATTLFAVFSPAVAEVTITYPVSVPQECVELAQREGVPIVIMNRYQAAKAKLKLARLSDRDPMVHQCREAVDRARKAALQNRAGGSISTIPPAQSSPPPQ
jgi:hypothetical protein